MSRLTDPGQRGATVVTPGRWIARGILVGGAAAYVLVLRTVYVERISIVWAYEGARYTPPAAGLEPVTWVFALLPALWLPTALRRPTQLLYWFLYVLMYVPSCLVPVFALSMSPDALLALQSCLAVCFFGLGRVHALPLLAVPRLRAAPFLFWLGLGLFSLVCYSLIASVAGLRLAVVSLDDVYDVRADYTNSIEEFGPLLGYVVSWQVSLVNPVLLAFGLAHRNLLAILLGLAAQFAMYAMTGFKTALFSGVLLLLVLGFVESRGRWLGIKILASVTMLILAAVAVDTWIDSNAWTAILVTRPVVIPGMLTGYYFEFFSQNPQALLGDSIFRGFVTYPYALGLPAVIGSMYVQGAWANGNVWADAYANFGYFGLFSFTLVLAAVMHVFDSVAADDESAFPALLAASYGWILANGALLTILLTNGLGFLLVLLYLMPRRLAGRRAT